MPYSSSIPVVFSVANNSKKTELSQTKLQIDISTMTHATTKNGSSSQSQDTTGISVYQISVARCSQNLESMKVNSGMITNYS